MSKKFLDQAATMLILSEWLSGIRILPSDLIEINSL